MKFLSVFTLLLISACSFEGAGYKDELVKTIENSDRLIVTEHSFEDDFYDQETEKYLSKTEITYRTVTVKESDRKKFISLIKALPSKTQDEFPACIFEPHHTIKFYRNMKLISTMKICFICGQVEWDGSKRTPPWSIYSGLEDFIKTIGLTPQQDWSTLARQAIKK